MNSIVVPQPKANRHIPPTTNLSETSSQTNDSIDLSGDLLDELGVSSQQFKILFDKLPQGVALYKMLYDKKGTPVDFVPIESNKAYDDIHLFKKERIGKRATASNPKIKDDPMDWIGIYGRVATTGVPEQSEMYCEPTDKWFQMYAYCPKKTYFFSIFMDITEQKKKNNKRAGRAKEI